MALISLQAIHFDFGGPLLFDALDFQLEAGERVALLGRNGMGKTTLMKIITGQEKVDAGEVIFEKGIRITYLPQEIPADIRGNVFDIVASGLGEQAKALSEYHQVSHALQSDQNPTLLRRLQQLQNEIDRTGSWEMDYRVKETLAPLELETVEASEFENLSGGQKRRVLLAKALVSNPDVLLLDEPTNHLDIRSIQWLETFLRNFDGALLFITHDREFMNQLATRIAELDRGKIMSWECNYRIFLERRQQLLDAEATQRAEFDKKLAAEEVWIRQGIRARRTRNEGRVRELKKLREEKRAQRSLMGKVKLEAQEADISGRKVIKAVHVYCQYGEEPLVKDFSVKVMRGDRIGIIGPNGCGKTTLIKVLLSEIPPQSGTVVLGTNLKIAYFDQLREQLDGEKSVAENVCGMSDTVVVNGKSRHIFGYLQDFLFSPDRAKMPVKVLSGGERNRLLLARLFTQPFNFLVMDEPTNDLDIETLELLEEILTEYSGTLILVSHDRYFLDNVVTSTWVFEEEGRIGEYAGGYEDWLRQRRPPSATNEKKKEEKKAAIITAIPKNVSDAAKKKLSYNEKQELIKLPAKIESLEREQQNFYAQFEQSDFYQKPADEIAKIQAASKALEKTIKETYERWEYLENLGAL